MKLCPRECLAEAAGTYILVFFGVGSVQAAVLTGAQSGIWQVAVVWGVAIALAIYSVGAISGAHLNPAVTIACAAFRGFPTRRIPGYVFAQLFGAFLAAATLHLLFAGPLAAFETSRHIVRGAPGSELSAMVFGEYFPNPAVGAQLGWTRSVVTPLSAAAAEAIGTAFLVFFILALTDRTNTGRPRTAFAPVMIGLIVSIVISVLAPISQAGLNPARDFGPRLYAFIAGWGPVAIPGPRGGFFVVYILAPVVGGLAGGALQRLFVLQPKQVEVVS